MEDKVELFGRHGGRRELGGEIARVLVSEGPA